MTGKAGAFPRFRPVADRAVLVEFAEAATAAAYADVIRLDSLLAAAPFSGFCEAVPAHVSLLVVFDPGVSDHSQVEAALHLLLSGPLVPVKTGPQHNVAVCYDDEFAPDLAQVARVTGLAKEAVIAAHLAGDYRVLMYGFAPGYAYLSGVASILHLPRKPVALRGVPAGSVLIAGGQCLVATLTMPTGWWIIGRSSTRVLRHDPARPFLFDIADRVRFRRITRAEYDARDGG